jgi:fluoride exporter
MEVMWEHPLAKIALVMIGGSLGALSRYGISLLSVRLFGTGFPWGTLLVNLGGCFMIGISFALADRSPVMNPSARLLFITGFLGALTTFSAFGYETFSAIHEGSHWLAMGNVLLNNVAGLILVYLGFRLGNL